MPTHEHYAGEFGLVKKTKKELQKDPAYRASRAAHYAGVATAAAASHASAKSEADKGLHALTAAAAAKKAEFHAKFVEANSPGSQHALSARDSANSAKQSYKSTQVTESTKSAKSAESTKSTESTRSKSSDTISKSSSTTTTNKSSSATTPNKSSSATNKSYESAATVSKKSAPSLKDKNNPEYRLSRVQHYLDIAKAAGVKHVLAKSNADAASAALEVAHAMKKVEFHTKAVGVLAPNSATHAKALSAKSEVEAIYHQTTQPKPQSVAINKTTDTTKNSGSESDPHTQNTTATVFEDKEFYEAKADFKKKLTTDEHLAILDYSGNHYEDINSALRRDKIDSSHDQIKDWVKNIDSALAKSAITQSVITYRGSTNPNIYQGMKPGDHYIEKGYSSTSASKGVATGFGSSVLMHVTIPAGSKAAVIPSKSASEKEVLLPRNQKFRVDKIEKTENGRLRLHVTAVQD